MDLQNILRFPETFVARDEGDPYLEIGRHPRGAVLGLRLTLTLFELPNGSKWAAVLACFCARQHGEPMDPAEARKLLSAFEFEFGNGECISEAVLPLVALPCSPTEIRTAYVGLRADLVSNLIRQLEAYFRESQLFFSMSRAVLRRQINARLERLIPNVSSTRNDISRFLFAFDRSYLHPKSM